MKSFDIDEYNYRECEVHNHGFYLGEQSKQAEVNELRKRIDDALNVMCKLQYSSGERIYDEVGKILKGDQS